MSAFGQKWKLERIYCEAFLPKSTYLWLSS